MNLSSQSFARKFEERIHNFGGDEVDEPVNKESPCNEPSFGPFSSVTLRIFGLSVEQWGVMSQMPSISH